MISFWPLTPLEHLSMIHREGIQAAMLCWLLGEDSPLPLDSRVRILRRLAQVDFDNCRSLNARTEVEDIDLLLTAETSAGTHAIAFEIKLKSSEHGEQLQHYDRVLSQFPASTRLFLTLTGEPPQGSDAWQAISYADLLHSLQPEVMKAERSKGYLRDYILMLARLSEAVELVCGKGPDTFAPHVFGLPGPGAADAGFARWVDALGLRVILQKAWMRRLGGKVLPLLGAPGSAQWSVSVDEAHAQALVDVWMSISDGTERYRLGVQVQHFAVKVFCHPDPYPKVVAEPQLRYVQAVLESLRKPLGLAPNHTMNIGRKRGYCSFTVAPRVTGDLRLDPWANLVADWVRKLQKGWQERATGDALKWIVSGDPASYSADDRERAWKETLARAIPPAPSGANHQGLTVAFRLRPDAAVKDVDNLCEPLFSVVVNRLGWLGGKRPNLQWWRATRSVDVNAGCTVALRSGPAPNLPDGRPLLDGLFCGALPTSAQDEAMAAWVRERATSAPGARTSFSVSLQFGDQALNVGEIADGRVKNIVDCLYPVLGGKPGAPEDWRIDWLQVEKNPAVGAGCVRIRVW